MLCTGPYWKGFGGRGLAGWIIVAGGQVLSCASHLLPSAPNTTAINPPCAKISTREAHGASAHRYLRKQQLLRGQNKRWHCWDVVGDILLEGRALCQSKHSPEGTVGHGVHTKQGHCGGTVSRNKPTLGWRKASKKQEATDTSPVSCIAPHFTEGIRSIWT